MLELEGQYNKAKVMIDTVDETTISQIYSFLNQPTFEGTNIAIMPDCHAGSGSCIGFTMPVNDYLIPNVIGVDIGCGMTSVCVGTDAIDLEKLDTVVKRTVPAGFDVHSKKQPVDRKLEREIQKVCYHIGLDSDRVFQSIGTLGGGNHFIELGVDTEGYHWLTVHSGSRNFGLKVANYYQEKARACEQFPGTPRGMEALPRESTIGKEYLGALRTAQQYAVRNREAMLYNIMTGMGLENVEHYGHDVIESTHNFIDEDQIIRKGATRAYSCEVLLIPFNMRDGIAICVGKGNSEWNNSAPHGAGRVLSRSKAKEQLDLDTFQDQMKQAGIYTTTANAGTLDEAPDAYKDMDLILKAIEPTADVLDLIKPIYNFKA